MKLTILHFLMREIAFQNQNVANIESESVHHRPQPGPNKNAARIESSGLSILPHKPKAGAKKWLLKMHGCVSHPEKI